MRKVFFFILFDMKISSILILFLSMTLTLPAQKIEQGFDINLRLSNAPRYYAITEKKGNLWFRQMFYLPEKSQAMEGWYSDEQCKVAEGEITWYHPNKRLAYNGHYKNGKKDGVWMTYHENGMILDSSTYSEGRLIGIALGWDDEGYLTDSSQFNGKGKGVMIHWYKGGVLAYAGFFINDTTKDQRWKYYHNNGQLWATEDYSKGERKSVTCFDENGNPLDLSLCIEQEANFKNDEKEWIRYLQRTLDPEVPTKKRAPVGEYTVMLQFIVNTDGTISKIKPLTQFGYGMEEEVISILKKSPKWNPAFQFGKKVKAYRKQPITFVVTP
jgi:antitoxin component YwqK of YwqJK toxin-antitoxin module